MRRLASAIRAALSAAAAIALLATVPGATPVTASEPLGDLNLDLKVVDVTPGPASRSARTEGVATLDVVLSAYRGAEDIRLRVLKADGTVWTVRSKPFDPGAIPWRTPEGGEPREGGAPSLAPGGTLVARVAVPLEGAAIHPIVVEVVAEVGGTTLRTENMVRVAFGVPMPLPVVGEDGVAAFPMEVQR